MFMSSRDKIACIVTDFQTMWLRVLLKDNAFKSFFHCSLMQILTLFAATLCVPLQNSLIKNCNCPTMAIVLEWLLNIMIILTQCCSYWKKNAKCHLNAGFQLLRRWQKIWKNGNKRKHAWLRSSVFFMWLEQSATICCLLCSLKHDSLFLSRYALLIRDDQKGVTSCKSLLDDGTF